MDIEQLKKVMKEKGITQIELAKLSGVPLQTLRYIFSGRTPNPRIDTMQAIEKALGLNQEPKDGFVLKDVYFRLGKEAQEMGLPPEDVDKIIKIFKELKK